MHRIIRAPALVRRVAATRRRQPSGHHHGGRHWFSAFPRLEELSSVATSAVEQRDAEGVDEDFLLNEFEDPLDDAVNKAKLQAIFDFDPIERRTTTTTTTMTTSSLDLELGEETYEPSPFFDEAPASLPEYAPITGWNEEATETMVKAFLEPEKKDEPKKQRPEHDERSTNELALEMLRNFDPDKPPDTDDLHLLQTWLECSAQQESILKYQKIMDDARVRKAYDAMSPMQKYVTQWYQPLKETIELRQQTYVSNQDEANKKSRKRYGPFLCNLQPEKLAVISMHEALSHLLLNGGTNGQNGVSLVSLVSHLGDAVQNEVTIQSVLKRRFEDHRTYKNSIGLEDDSADDSDENVFVDENDFSAPKKSNTASSEPPLEEASPKWAFSTSHLKEFFENEKRMNPNFTATKRSIEYTLGRIEKTMSDIDKWSSADKAHLGAALLSMLMENAKVVEDGKADPAIRIEKRYLHRQRKTQSYVVLDDRLVRAFLEEDIISFAATASRHMPMIVPPKNWTAYDQGGYQWLKVDLMRFNGSNKQKDVLKRANLSKVFDGLNKLGATPWRINKRILEAAEYCWDNNIAIGEIPSRTDLDVPPEPKKPPRIAPELFADVASPARKAAIDQRSAYRDTLYKYRRTKQKNMDLRSLRCSAVLKLNQAAKFKDFDEIYFPYNLDFRGRAYPVPPHLSNVGSDLSRGVLTFADAKPLGKKGLYWLKVHLANFAGKDKMSFDDRAKYIEDNLDNVRESVSNSFGKNPWWMTLEDPFQGLATCHEIIQAIDSGDPESYMCRLPVHMDGSCNGLQHYAALLRDIGGGAAVNLIESEGPQDVYIGVMHEVIRRVAEEADRILEFDTSNEDELSRAQKAEIKKNKAAKLVNGLIDRGVVKRTVMTSVYGVTQIGARQQILEKIEEKLEDQGHDIDEISSEIFSAAGYLAKLTMDVMGDLFQGARNTQNWLTNCARLISQQNHPVSWVSPIGVPAIQPYTERRSSTIVTLMQSITLSDIHDDMPIHKARQVTAFPPNYIHSLDSSHMLLTALEMDRRGLAFSAVHDSFWTHACDVDEMNEALRDTFVDLYSRPLLEDLKASWELRYPGIEFPELPTPGDLDLEEIKKSTYFFQ